MKDAKNREDNREWNFLHKHGKENWMVTHLNGITFVNMTIITQCEVVKQIKNDGKIGKKSWIPRRRNPIYIVYR